MPDRTDTAPIISRQPSWATETRIDPDAIVHWWTAPTIAQSIERDGAFAPAAVEAVREDMLYVNGHGVVLDPGPERIFLLDTDFDAANARLLAAAIVECCDRVDGVTSS